MRSVLGRRSFGPPPVSRVTPHTRQARPRPSRPTCARLPLAKSRIASACLSPGLYNGTHSCQPHRSQPWPNECDPRFPPCGASCSEHFLKSPFIKGLQCCRKLLKERIAVTSCNEPGGQKSRIAHTTNTPRDSDDGPEDSRPEARSLNTNGDVDSPTREPSAAPLPPHRHAVNQSSQG